MGCDIHGTFQRKTQRGWQDVDTEYEFNRHYQLFAVLAGVRNGHGFASISTGDPVTPISEPRGIPDDFTGDLGDHSFSWLTDEEMLAYEFPRVTHRGVITREQFQTWDGEAPSAYCVAVIGPNVVMGETHFQVEWLTELKEELAYFFDEVRRLKELYGEVRFVFGFDS